MKTNYDIITEVFKEAGFSEERIEQVRAKMTNLFPTIMCHRIPVAPENEAAMKADLKEYLSGVLKLGRPALDAEVQKVVAAQKSIDQGN